MLFGSNKKDIGQTKVLLVDDDEDMVAIVTLVLKRKGFDVTTAPNGQECLNQTSASIPDIILLDNQMPIMDGMTTIVKLKESKHTKDIPVIMLTGNDDKSYIDKAQQCDCADYVVKPFDYDLLVEKINAALTVRN